MGASIPEILSGVVARDDVARLLSTSTKQLNYLLYGRASSRRYTSFAIPKRNGSTRTISAPREDLKVLQMKLASVLTNGFQPRSAVFGFVQGRSIVGNAAKHVGCRFVLNVDIQDFFPSIHIGRVIGLFGRLGASRAAAIILAQLACHEGVLPQVAPTSPVISNLICARLDRELCELAGRCHCYYTRYVDDLTFSRKQGAFPPELARYEKGEGRAIVGAALRAIIEGNGFRPNPEKVWLFSQVHRQRVTGLVVNRKVNVSRDFIRELRAMINAWDTYGLSSAQDRFYSNYLKGGCLESLPGFREVVRGKIEFVRMVKGPLDPVYKNLQKRLVVVDETYLEVMLEENSKMDKRDVFISHASEDKEAVARPLTELLVQKGLRVWFDEYDIAIGDSIREQIDIGLTNSTFGVVVFSPKFLSVSKTWPGRELDGLLAGEDVSKRRRILPIWHNVTQSQIAKAHPTLAGLKAAVTANETLEQIASMIVDKVNKYQSE